MAMRIVIAGMLASFWPADAVFAVSKGDCTTTQGGTCVVTPGYPNAFSPRNQACEILAGKDWKFIEWQVGAKDYFESALFSAAKYGSDPMETTTFGATLLRFTMDEKADATRVKFKLCETTASTTPTAAPNPAPATPAPATPAPATPAPAYPIGFTMDEKADATRVKFKLCETTASTTPTADPNASPSPPSGQPTTDPNAPPTQQPTTDPNAPPSGQPTTDPNAPPTQQPTTDPNAPPSGQPTTDPNAPPSGQPTTDPNAPSGQQPTTDPN
eukprot:CAMPEP_0204610326 /NCGR_PEP_ID=MMETSP0661-20131031/61446_1 /ASSEMBLY_ACC=CAM_ASM_000606 /TAXON_ID=109239 /ORGANISM="Alexandrium margalefi, Strain AMGDE01CS-322" /LENGTH=270 /DNA_ID=CAMNT_0051622133 /DNA_START=51 /DNA_END=861 /DNA_ORIENTATION=-